MKPFLRIFDIPIMSVGLLILSLMMGGCRQSAGGVPINPTATTESAPVITISYSNESPRVGDDMVFVTVIRGGRVIGDATVEVRGDMTHAGMRPILGEAIFAQVGTYRVPFDWVMGGDWILSVAVTLPDGQIFTQRVDVTVTEP